MNPIYKFQLSAGNDTRQAFPVYKDDLAIDYALEQNQEFYRGKLSGKLTFQKDDYLFIRNKAFDTQFDVVMSISYDGGQTWAVYWSGQFWKTDCKFNEDDQTAIVTPNVNDRYNAVLAGMDKEYNLIDLAPVIQPVKLDKRPMIQVYVPGQTVIGCFLSGMWWEQECEAVYESDTVEIEGPTYPALEYKYHFAFNKAQRQILITQTGTPIIPELFYGIAGTGDYEFENDGYKFKYETQDQYYYFDIIRTSDNVTLWATAGSGEPPSVITLNPVTGTGATGTVEATIYDVKVYSRYITDVENALGLNNNVFLLGYRSDLENYVNAADLVVSASLREGLGLNVIEGMICGKPAVVSDNRGHRELVVNGENGFRVNALSDKEFAERIIEIFSSESLYKKFSEKTVQMAKPFTIEPVTKELKNIYEELLDK